jgi:hypothetical protein
MFLPREFVELLETHADISIRDDFAEKRFVLVYRSRGRTEPGSVWLSLTLEPGQEIVASSCRLRRAPVPRVVLLEFPFLPENVTSEIVFATVERLRPENGFARVETFNAFLAQESARLARRTATVRIESPRGVASVFSPTHPVSVEFPNAGTALLRLDVRGGATLGRFRFFYALGTTAPAAIPEEPPQGPALRAGIPLAKIALSTTDRELIESRRSRPRRRGSLRRSA